MNRLFTFSLVGIFLLMFLALDVNIASAIPYAEGDALTLRVACSDINCTGVPLCNMSVFYPNSTALITNQNATFQASFYSYNFTIPEISGNYDYTLFCTPTNSFSSSFPVTPNGEEPTIAKAIFYLGLLGFLVFFIILIFWAHMQDQSHLAKFWWFSFMWIPFWAVLFIGWSMARDFLTSQGAIEAVLYYAWWIVGMLYPFYIIGLILYTFYWIYQQREVQNLVKRGFSLEDAQARVGGRGRGMYQ